MTRKAFSVIRLLIIYKSATSELGSEKQSLPRHTIFSKYLDMLIYFIKPMDLKHSDVRQNSPRELSFHFCFASAMVLTGRTISVLLLLRF